MLISRDREKLIEAIKFFRRRTKHCGLTKLFKLLYFLDFTHFRKAGRSVTGLTYLAYPKGPVPESLYDEIKNKKQLDGQIIIHEYEEIEGSTGSTYAPAQIKFEGTFSPSYFTKRELKIMEDLAYIFQDVTAAQMSEVSHLKGKPWDTARRTFGNRAAIDYMLSLDNTDPEQLTADEVIYRLEVKELAKKVFS